MRNHLSRARSDRANATSRDRGKLFAPGRNWTSIRRAVPNDVTETNAARPLALGGVSVVELGQGVSAAFATKLMALMGATVIKVEPPEGDVTRRRGPFPGDLPDPEKSGLFQYLNADKRGITLDLVNPGDRRTLDDAPGRRRHPDSQYCALPTRGLRIGQRRGQPRPSTLDRHRHRGLRRIRPARRLSRL